jgi:protease IV
VRPFSPEERARVAENMQATYDTFVEKAAQGRNTTPEKIDAIAQGRVWTGRQGKQNGLVDELGGLDRAVSIAKQRAKIAADSDVELVVYPPRKSFYELLSDQFSGGESVAVSAWLNANLSAGELEALRIMRGPFAMFRRGEPLFLMPFTFLR